MHAQQAEEEVGEALCKGLSLLMLVGQALPEPPEGGTLSFPMHIIIMMTAFLSVPFFAIPAVS